MIFIKVDLTFHWGFHNQLHSCKGIHFSLLDILNMFSFTQDIEYN